MRILVAAGGTAGHLAPALVVADELRDRGHTVVFAGSRGRIEETAVPERGYPLHLFDISGLPRKPGKAQAEALRRAMKSLGSTRRIVASVEPDVVFGGGGFVSAPVAMAARMGGVPVVVTEADNHLGLANRFAARFAQRLCTAFPLPEFRAKQEVTGRPVAREFFDVDKTTAREELGIPVYDLVALTFGGSGGARRLSEAMRDAWADDDDPRVDGTPLWLLHVTGKRDHAEFKDIPCSDRYRVIEYSDDMPNLIGASDVVVSRAGGSVFEIAAVGRPAVLVPYPYATADHQAKNAEYFAKHGGAVVLRDVDCDGTRLRLIVEGLLDGDAGDRRRELGERWQQVARPDAASRVADAIESAGATFARAADSGKGKRGMLGKRVHRRRWAP